MLQISSGIDEAGFMNWKLALCLLIAWVLVYFCIWRGIRSSAKIVYVTATLPYVILAIFFIRSVTLPGSATGILYYVTPQWHRLGDPKVYESITWLLKHVCITSHHLEILRYVRHLDDVLKRVITSRHNGTDVETLVIIMVAFGKLNRIRV